MTIPPQGSGIIDTGYALLGSLSYDEPFRCPDALYPQSEATLQYQLALILEACGGRVYPEVRLGDSTEAIDLVWYDPDHERKVGIEVKRTGTVQDASNQVALYRDYALDDTRISSQFPYNSHNRSANDIHVLDAVWIATYAEPRAKYPSAPSKPDVLELVPEADGQLCFHSHSGRLYCDITEPSDRETLPVQRGPIGKIVEPEAKLVADL